MYISNCKGDTKARKALSTKYKMKKHTKIKNLKITLPFKAINTIFTLRYCIQNNI